jgi:hypothetical protein
MGLAPFGDLDRMHFFSFSVTSTDLALFCRRLAVTISRRFSYSAPAITALDVLLRHRQHVIRGAPDGAQDAPVLGREGLG